MRLHVRSVTVAIILLVLSGCVGNRPYRLGGIADDQYEDQKPAFEVTRIDEGKTYRLSFVEFDEKGDFWDRRQLGQTNRKIAGAGKPVLLVIYIHGWHHN